MYRHGLRVSEAISLRWEQFDLKGGLLSVQRLKHGVPSTHPLRGLNFGPCVSFGVSGQTVLTCSSRSVADR